MMLSFISFLLGVSLAQELIHYKSAPDIARCENMGYCQVKDQSIQHKLTKGKKILYDVTYQFDSFRRRITPHENHSANKHLIVTGCSFALGVGLEDNQTLPYFLAKENNTIIPYNYGIAGSGTNSMLAQTENYINQKAVPQSEGYFVYILLNFHVPRSNALAMEREWLWDTPYYEKVADKLEYRGNFKEAQPLLTTFYHQTQKILKRLGVKLNYPPLRHKHYRYTCDLIHQARQIYKARFPRGRFVVYDHPYDELNSVLKSCLKEKMVEVIPSKIITDSNDYFPHDNHPTMLLNQKIALEISEYLKTKHSLDSY